MDGHRSKYKFFHKYNSVVVPSMQGKQNPWRYPFADIFIYSYDKKYNLLNNEQWRGIQDGIGFNATVKWPKGTTLTRFGDFEMRISTENEKYLQLQFSSNWRDVGVTSWFDHWNIRQEKTTSFKIPQNLYCPSKPFSLPRSLSNYTCKEIVLEKT